MQQQDSSDPTGVAVVPGTKGGPSVARSRQRKAHAAIELKMAGATDEEIALTLGYPTPRQAKIALESALEKRLDEEDKAKLRRLAGMRLDRLLSAVWQKAVNPEDPEQLLAVTKAREVIADHRKLYGLDAPGEYVVHSPSQDALQAWVAKAVQLSAPPVVEYDILELDDDDVEETRALPAH